MKSNKNIKNKKTIWLIIFLFWIIWLFSSIKAQDLLQQIFEPSIARDQVIDLWNTKNAVWNEVLRESLDVELDLNRCKDAYWNAIDIPTLESNRWWKTKEAYCTENMWWTRDDTIVDVNLKAPLIVRIAKTLLRITIVISITMVLYAGIMYIIQAASGKELWSLDAKKNLFYVAWWLLLALFSLAIINLISSIGLSTIMQDENTDNWDWWTEISKCTIDWVSLNSTQEIKKYICLNKLDWIRNERAGNNCWIFTWKEREVKISTAEQKDWCAWLWWEYKNPLIWKRTCTIWETIYTWDEEIEEIICTKYYWWDYSNKKCKTKLDFINIDKEKQEEYCKNDEPQPIDWKRWKVKISETCKDLDWCFCEMAPNYMKNIIYNQECTPNN